MPGGLISLVVLGKKDKKGPCCPACAAKMAEQVRRKQPNYKRRKV